uniref:Uncharacterized protein n=1 Tax=Globodera rostochiensis TaxID=31243 RepID=A0A914IBX3_GLORO
MHFYYAFVNCVSEIAYFRVVNNNPEVCANLNQDLYLKLGFGEIFEPLNQHIANEINKKFLCPEEPLPRAVVDQLLMLSFTFAVRFIVSVDYYDYYYDWQLETLLSAYKILSISTDDTNGVFPFQIFQFSYFKSLRVIEFTNQKITKEHTSEPNQYIENFKFLLKLSDYTLTLFDMYKLLETILIEAKGMDNESNVRALGEQPRALYTFVKQYFVENIDNKISKFSLLKPNFFRNQSKVQTSKKQLLRCALVAFGMGINRRTYDYSDYAKYYEDIKNECSEVEFEFKPHKHVAIFKIRLFAIELESFHEPLTSYTRVIAIEFKGVAQFAVFQKYSDDVKYDGKYQLMSFPQMLAERFLERLYTLTQKKWSAFCKIDNQVDFVQTMRMIASTEQLEFNYSFFEFKINISHKMVEINLPNWKSPDYMQNRIINELRQAKVKENFNFILSLSDYPPTLYELLKMAKKLGEIELLEKDDKKLGEMKKNHEMWLNSSESKIFFEIMKYLKHLQEPIQKIKINPENEFCVLAYFVEDLLAGLATENKIPNVESIEVAIGQFILTKQEFCTENSIENDDKKYFDENLVNFSKAINIDFSPRDELQQIVPEIVEEIKQMLQNDNWNYSHLNYIKIVEWDLLEFNLHKIGKDQKWEQIKQLRAKSQKAFSDWRPCGVLGGLKKWPFDIMSNDVTPGNHITDATLGALNDAYRVEVGNGPERSKHLVEQGIKQTWLVVSVEGKKFLQYKAYAVLVDAVCLLAVSVLCMIALHLTPLVAVDANANNFPHGKRHQVGLRPYWLLWIWISAIVITSYFYEELFWQPFCGIEDDVKKLRQLKIVRLCRKWLKCLKECQGEVFPSIPGKLSHAIKAIFKKYTHFTK